MLDEGQRNDWFSSHGIVAAAIIAAVGIDRRWWSGNCARKDPVVDFHLLKDRNFAISTIDHVHSRLCALWQHHGAAAVSADAARLHGDAERPGAVARRADDHGHDADRRHFCFRKIEARWLMIFGLLMSSVGLFQMSHFDLQIDFRHAVTARVVQSFGLAFLFVPINTVAFFVHRQGRTPATPRA